MMLNAYYNEIIVVVRASKPGDWGEPSEPEYIEQRARVDYVNELVRNLDGEEVASAVKVLLPYDASLYYDDRIRIGNLEHSIIRIDRMQDFSARYLLIRLT